MNWTQTSKYCLQSGDWRIAKRFVGGQPRYTVFQMPGQVLIKTFKTLDKAKGCCEEYRRAEKETAQLDLLA